MNDLILQARLYEQGVEKALPAVMGKETNPIANVARSVREGMSYGQAQRVGEQKRAGRFAKKRIASDMKNLAAGTPTTGSGKEVSQMAGAPFPDGTSVDPAQRGPTEADVGNVADEMAKRKTTPAAPAAPPADQATQQAPAANQNQQAPATNVVDTTGAGGANGNPAMPDTVDEKTTTTLNADGSPQEVKTTTTNTLNPEVQNMAQKFQAGQDMQTIQQGKGAEKKGYFGGRSGLGMLADVATLGATSQFGSTGGIARRKANKQSDQQTQQYNQAQGRMNQRNMGMSPIMTSHDRLASALLIRKSIQERNTTRNLRR
jgi:hypothetical protein